jgi:hypothetical protein
LFSTSGDSRQRDGEEGEKMKKENPGSLTQALHFFHWIRLDASQQSGRQFSAYPD